MKFEIEIDLEQIAVRLSDRERLDLILLICQNIKNHGTIQQVRAAVNDSALDD